MPWMKWLPWRYLVRRFATSHGFLDPLAVMARLQRFAEPSEVNEPIELLRAGAVFHARALINSKVIQHNLDWIWPHWIERQFNPRDESFIPRAFSITHCNLSHRNWTAVGVPDCEEMPIVDPRGLVTPHYDGWSIDAWVLGKNGRQLLPSKLKQCSQRLEMDENISVVTESSLDDLQLQSRVKVERDSSDSHCLLELIAESGDGGWLVITLRPCNPEGISFLHQVRLDKNRRCWLIEDKTAVIFERPVEKHLASNYRQGDIYLHLRDETECLHGECEVGMASAAAMFSLAAGTPLRIGVRIPLHSSGRDASHRDHPSGGWQHNLKHHCTLSVPDRKFQFLYDAAIRTLILHSPKEVYPGPYTYKRFWFRDAVFIIQSLLQAGLTARAERALDQFPKRQKHDGFFLSQDGEWDSNGEALWIFDLFCQMTNRPLKREWREPVLRGARWIVNKRLHKNGGRCGGLLPAGFSAEHLGPNDCYYWDDFWGVAGLRAAARICKREELFREARAFSAEADDFQKTIEDSLAAAARRLGRAAMPASPNRRLDAGAIGSIVAGYPLQLYPAQDPRLTDLTEFLLERCFVSGGFFQDMVHSGINAYLTLHIAQVLLRSGDSRCFELMRNVAALASPTGQWPEAIHPHSMGGCMGDGQHAWAAAEWVSMMRNCFVREEGESLILISGLPSEWLTGESAQKPIHFGPAPTRFGTIDLEVIPGTEPQVSWTTHWHSDTPRIEIRPFGFRPIGASPGENRVTLSPL
ncbi:hypothetical protein [Microbulbifer thermotolerans]|uniref:Uncharacterized protein n=1 Tax=Microbulbifer thermotolerans TaxID=252514 RepID=A0A143HLV4_MICTH|nr:hypothetical protein [Microbulbifer thermotolerans]AMX02487.1 hypothetical protein A3224_07715 [Microbulbifer thermotolerans]MCX2779339.1 hypothetical protein [Microbulbifer thermotolerans]MCX2800610.1 hypothetical protein [Microbulbifer thermotolerans]MCX2805759.1 hypothetical protein [Microbulbifer thermotolerans]MCX2840041.1 hypothetical protein [Microbulbifer thermotolerans]